MARLVVSGETRCLSLKKLFEVTALELLLRKERDESADAEWIRWGAGQPVGPVGSCVRRKCIEFFLTN